MRLLDNIAEILGLEAHFACYYSFTRLTLLGFEMALLVRRILGREFRRYAFDVYIGVFGGL